MKATYSYTHTSDYRCHYLHATLTTVKRTATARYKEGFPGRIFVELIDDNGPPIEVAMRETWPNGNMGPWQDMT